jgi:hypothetical protein
VKKEQNFEAMKKNRNFLIIKGAGVELFLRHGEHILLRPFSEGPERRHHSSTGDPQAFYPSIFQPPCRTNNIAKLESQGTRG